MDFIEERNASKIFPFGFKISPSRHSSSLGNAPKLLRELLYRTNELEWAMVHSNCMWCLGIDSDAASLASPHKYSLWYTFCNNHTTEPCHNQGQPILPVACLGMYSLIQRSWNVCHQLWRDCYFASRLALSLPFHTRIWLISKKLCSSCKQCGI